MQFSDDFNRANETPLGSATGYQWYVAVGGHNMPNLVNQKVASTVFEWRHAKYIGINFVGVKQFAQAYYETTEGNPAACVRLQGTPEAGLSGYQIQVSRGGSGESPPLGQEGPQNHDRVNLVRWNLGISQNLYSWGTGADGYTAHTLRIEVLHSSGLPRLIGKIDGNTVFDVVDTTPDPIYGGNPGMGIVGIDVTEGDARYTFLDDFVCGGDIALQFDATAVGVAGLAMRMRPGPQTGGQAYFRMVDSFMGHGTLGPLHFGGHA